MMWIAGFAAGLATLAACAFAITSLVVGFWRLVGVGLESLERWWVFPAWVSFALAVVCPLIAGAFWLVQAAAEGAFKLAGGVG